MPLKKSSRRRIRANRANAKLPRPGRKPWSREARKRFKERKKAREVK